MFCKSCGKEINDKAVVCVGCGIAVSPDVPAVIAAGVSNKKELTQTERWAGWIGALIMPIIGIIMGILAMTKGKIGEGVGMIILSVFMTFFWMGFMNGG